MGPADGCRGPLGNVRPRAGPAPSLQAPEIFLDFLARPLDLVLPSRRSRHPLAAAEGVTGGKGSFGTDAGQVRAGVRNPGRYVSSVVTQPGALCCAIQGVRNPGRHSGSAPQGLGRQNGRYLRAVTSSFWILPPTVTCGSHHELHAAWSPVSGRRFQVQGWAMDSAGTGRRAFWEGLSRNSHRKESSHRGVAATSRKGKTSPGSSHREN